MKFYVALIQCNKIMSETGMGTVEMTGTQQYSNNNAV